MDLERRSPELTLMEAEDFWYDAKTNLEWICSDGMIAAWGDDVLGANKIRLVGTCSDPYRRINGNAILAQRRHKEPWRFSRFPQAIERCEEYAHWLEEFGPDVTLIWIYWEQC